ncbi:MAG: XisI protein [Saprospiraceae bacterium]
MDKINQYRDIIEAYLRRRAEGALATEPGAQAHVLIDREKDEYALLWVGWSGYRYKHGIMFHLQIIDKKVWVHEDRTDSDIAGQLQDAGIPKSDIVLGYVSPEIRETGGYAVA